MGEGFGFVFFVDWYVVVGNFMLFNYVVKVIVVGNNCYDFGVEFFIVLMV